MPTSSSTASSSSNSRAYNYIPMAKPALSTLITTSASSSPSPSAFLSSTPNLYLKQKHYKSNFNNILETDDELNTNDNDYSAETRSTSLAKSVQPGRTGSNAHGYGVRFIDDDNDVNDDDDNGHNELTTRKQSNSVNSIRKPVVSLSSLNKQLEHRFYQNKRENKNYRKYILNDNIQKLLKKYSVY